MANVQNNTSMVENKQDEGTEKPKDVCVEIMVCMSHIVHCCF